MSTPQPDVYQIRVNGQLDPRLSAWFEDFTISHTPDGDTLLTGAVIDQAALHGVLVRCRDLGATILSVNPLTVSQENQETHMNTYHVESTLVINARPEILHDIIADYRVSHPAILPRPTFTDLVVEKGGYGAGTVVVVKLKMLGKEYTYHQAVTEPEPGRVIMETDIETGQYTTFTFEPLNGGKQTRMTIASEFPRKPGLVGLLEARMSPPIVRNLYLKELKNVAAYVQTNPRAVAAK